MSTAAAIALRPQPFRGEARDYCERFGIYDAEECERVRLSMVQREFLNRCAPWHGMLAKALAYETDLHQPSQRYRAMEHQVREVIAVIGRGLGLSLEFEPRQPDAGIATQREET